MIALCRAVGLLPWGWLRAAGSLLGAFVGSFLRIRRGQVEGAMRRAGIDPVSATARAMYASLGTALLEFLWLVGRRASPVFAMKLTDRARTAIAEARTRGAVIATGHTGNWDLVACAAAEGHLPLTVVTKRLRVGWLDRLWQRERAARGIELLDGEGVFERAARSLAQGRSVAIIVDQAPERRSAVTEAVFLGETARCDMTAALLAARSGRQLLLALGRRAPDGTHLLDIPLIVEPPPRPTLSWARETTRALNAELERFVRADPAQWLWLHRRWKRLPDSALPQPGVVLSLEP